MTLFGKLFTSDWWQLGGEKLTQQSAAKNILVFNQSSQEFSRSQTLYGKKDWHVRYGHARVNKIIWMVRKWGCIPIAIYTCDPALHPSLFLHACTRHVVHYHTGTNRQDNYNYANLHSVSLVPRLLPMLKSGERARKIWSRAPVTYYAWFYACFMRVLCVVVIIELLPTQVYKRWLAVVGCHQDYRSALKGCFTII